MAKRRVRTPGRFLNEMQWFIVKFSEDGELSEPLRASSLENKDGMSGEDVVFKVGEECSAPWNDKKLYRGTIVHIGETKTCCYEFKKQNSSVKQKEKKRKKKENEADEPAVKKRKETAEERKAISKLQAETELSHANTIFKNMYCSPVSLHSQPFPVVHDVTLQSDSQPITQHSIPVSLPINPHSELSTPHYLQISQPAAPYFLPIAQSISNPQSATSNPQSVTSNPQSVTPNYQPVTPYPQSVTPNYQPVTPNSQSTTHHSQHVTPNSFSATPISQHVTPYSLCATPNSQHVTPNSKHVTPHSQPDTPQSGTLISQPFTPYPQSVTPNYQPVTPNSQSTTHHSQHVTPNSFSATPISQHVTPYSLCATPNSQHVTPNSKHVTPHSQPDTPQSGTLISQPFTPYSLSATPNYQPVAPNSQSTTHHSQHVTPNSLSATPNSQPNTPQSGTPNSQPFTPYSLSATPNSLPVSQPDAQTVTSNNQPVYTPLICQNSESSPDKYISHQSPFIPLNPSSSACGTFNMSEAPPKSFLNSLLMTSEDCGNCFLKDERIESLRMYVQKLERDIEFWRNKSTNDGNMASRNPANDEDHYYPKRGVRVDRCVYTEVEQDDAPPKHHVPLCIGHTTYVPSSWLKQTEATFRGKSASFCLKMMMNGFYHPKDVNIGMTGSSLIKTSIGASLQAYAVDVLKMDKTSIIKAFNTKIHTLLRAKKNLGYI